jgi:hypothetical protein
MPDNLKSSLNITIANPLIVSELQPENIVFKKAYPQEKLADLMKFRSCNPLYGLFLLQHLGFADRAERLQIFESILELPPSIGPKVRVPKQDILPNGILATERVDPLLISLGLATVDELVPKTEEELDEERENRRHFAGWMEERTYVISLAEKMKRLFEYEYPAVDVCIFPVWAAGDILLDYKGDFNKYVVARAMQKQEGVIYRHCLRLILLLDEFVAMKPADGTAEDWAADLTDIKESLLECCRRVDPQSTDQILEQAQNAV